MREDIKSVLITEEQIKKRVQEMGEQLSKEYEGKRVIIICLLKGAAFFACDLSRAMSIPVRMEFMVASSGLCPYRYGWNSWWLLPMETVLQLPAVWPCGWT